MWPVQQAPVRNGRNRGKQLNGRDAHLLAHRNRPDGDCRPVLEPPQQSLALAGQIHAGQLAESEGANVIVKFRRSQLQGEDRKSTRLNSSHPSISYAVFCLKKKRTGPPSPRGAKTTKIRRTWR